VVPEEDGQEDPAREIPNSEPIPKSVWTIPVAKPR
jgi:hypothetical protein